MAAALVLFGCSFFGCKSTSDPAPEQAAPATKPEAFRFALPDGYVKLELRGEGSERLSVPQGARVTRTNKGFTIEAGSDFAIEVVSAAPTLSAIGLGPGVSRVMAESDAHVFKSAHGYSFVVTRELVPEWDESDVQRFACGSAGGVVQGGTIGADARGFSKSAVEAMVAACRTLELPALE
jgi:hypothetical protein